MKRIGDFRLDSTNQCLWRESTAVALSPKAFGILDFLSKRPGQLVAHDELLDAVWHDTHVQPEGIKVYISELRRALGDTAQEPNYIETVHRRGYRLLAKTADEPEPSVGVDRAEHPFVGREAELDVLDEHLRSASAGTRRLVFIRGETGVGKTALLDELLIRASRQPLCWVAHGQCIRGTGEAEPFSPVLEALNGLIAGDRHHPLVSVLRQVAPCWLVQFPHLLDASEREAMQRELVRSTSQRMIREFCALIDQACGDHLCVIAIDDLHRADPSTVRLIEALALHDEPARLFIVGTYRSGQTQGQLRLRELVAGLHSRSLCQVMELAGISESALKTYIELRFHRSDLNAAFLDQIYLASGGVPLFFTAYLDFVQAEAALLDTPDTWFPVRGTIKLSNAVPDTLEELVDLWLSRLHSEEQIVLETASLIGLEFSAWLVSAAAELELDRVEKLCSGLVRAGGWLRSSGFDETGPTGISARFTFIHELFRDAIYERQTDAERVKRHIRIASALEAALGERAAESAPRLAAHFEAGQDYFRGIRYLREAANNACRRYSEPEAAALLQRALEMANTLPEPARESNALAILSQLGELYLTTGDLERSVGTWQRVVTQAVNNRQIDIAATALSKSVLAIGWSDVESLRSVAEQVIRLSSDVLDPVTRAMATVRALVARDIAVGWFAGDSAACRKALEEVTRGPDAVEMASARILYTWFQLCESAYNDAIHVIQDDLPALTQADRFMDVLRAQWGLAWALLHNGELARMRSVTTSVILSAAKRGNEPVEALFTYLLAWLHVECGAYDSALEFCSNTRRVYPDSGSAVGSALHGIVCGFAQLGGGRPDAALEQFEHAQQACPGGRGLWFLLSQTGTIEALLAQSNVAAACRTAEALCDHAGTFPERTWTALALRSCARAAAANSHWQEAARYLHQALKLVDESNLPLAAWRVYRTASEIYGEMGGKERSGEYLEKSRAAALSLVKSLDPDDALSRAFAEFSGVVGSRVAIVRK